MVQNAEVHLMCIRNALVVVLLSLNWIIAETASDVQHVGQNIKSSTSHSELTIFAELRDLSMWECEQGNT